MNTIIVALMLNILYVFYFLSASTYGFSVLNAVIRGEFLDLSIRERINLLKLSLQLFKNTLLLV